MITTLVSAYQFAFGFALLPVLSLPAFCRVPFSEMPLQLTRGWKCFLGEVGRKKDGRTQHVERWMDGAAGWRGVGRSVRHFKSATWHPHVAFLDVSTCKCTSPRKEDGGRRTEDEWGHHPFFPLP